MCVSPFQPVAYESLIKISYSYGACIHVSERCDVLQTRHEAAGTTVGHTSHCAIQDEHMHVGSYLLRGTGEDEATQVYLAVQQVYLAC